MAMNHRLLRPLAGFSPKQFPGLQMWLDASDQSSMTLNGSTVSEWRSKAGSIALTQGTAGAQPTLTANYAGSRSALTFDGGDVLSTTAAGLAIAPSTSFLVFDVASAVNFAGVLIGSPSSGDDFGAGGSRFITTANDGGNNQSAVRGANPNTTASDALSASFQVGAGAWGKRLMAVRCSSSTAVMRIGGVNGTQDSAHTQSGTTSGIVVGGRFLSGAISASFRLNGKMCEILHYSQELSVAQTQTIERWLASRWGITL